MFTRAKRRRVYEDIRLELRVVPSLDRAHRDNLRLSTRLEPIHEDVCQARRHHLVGV